MPFPFESGRKIDTMPYVQTWLLAALSDTTVVPPRTTVFDGARAATESWIAVGAQPGVVMYNGAPKRPAKAAPASASGKLVPVAKNMVSVEPFGKKWVLISAAVEYRS